MIRYFDQEFHIWIKTIALGYAINGVLSVMTLNQHFSDYVTHKNHSNFSKFHIGQ